jgi:hypothetical protein
MVTSLRVVYLIPLFQVHLLHLLASLSPYPRIFTDRTLDSPPTSCRNPTVAMSALFPATRSLLYPQFETYRLKSLDQETDLTSHSLPIPGATQSRVAYATSQHLLSFKEVRARIAWNHLATGSSGRGVYIDAEMGVVGFTIDVRGLSRLLESADLGYRKITDQHSRN